MEQVTEQAAAGFGEPLNVGAMFADELKPVGSKAQRKVALPPGPQRARLVCAMVCRSPHVER